MQPRWWTSHRLSRLPNLQVERQLGLRPYWIPVRADQILGWRKDGDSPISPVGQIRINEYVQENIGAFGDRTIRKFASLNAVHGAFGARVRMAGSSTRTAPAACL